MTKTTFKNVESTAATTGDRNRAPYESPRLTALGSVTELTHSNSIIGKGGQFQDGINSKQKQ